MVRRSVRAAHHVVEVARVVSLRWAVVSHERAVANARAASVECSRRLLERLEVDLAVERLRQAAEQAAPAARAARASH